MLVNSLLVAEPNEAARALLSDLTLVSPAHLGKYRVGDWSAVFDRHLGLAFWNAANTRALDQICGLSPGSVRRGGTWVSVPQAMKLGMALKELMIQAAEDLCKVLTTPGQQGNALAARRIIRDGGFLFCAARILGTEGKDTANEATEMLRKGGVLENPYLQRQVPIIRAYAGISGDLLGWYRRVDEQGFERQMDAAVLVTYLAAPQRDDSFVRALAWGQSRDTQHVLEWAGRNWSTVAARWVSYIRYCLDNAVYSLVPDLVQMVARWPVELVTTVGVDEKLLTELLRRVEQFIEECHDRDLRATGEKVLGVLRQSHPLRVRNPAQQAQQAVGGDSLIV